MLQKEQEDHSQMRKGFRRSASVEKAQVYVGESSLVVVLYSQLSTGIYGFHPKHWVQASPLSTLFNLDMSSSHYFWVFMGA